MLLLLAVLCSWRIKADESIRAAATGVSWRRKKPFGDGAALAGIAAWEAAHAHHQKREAISTW